MKLPVYFLLTTTLILALTSGSSGQGKLNSSKSELKSGGVSSGRTYRSEYRPGYHYNDVFYPLLVEGFLYITYYSMVGNYSSEEHLKNEITPYPYFDGKSGNYIEMDDTPKLLKPIRVDIENNFMIGDDNVLGNRLNIGFRPFKYAFIQADYLQLAELDNSKTQLSRLSIFNFDICYDRLRLRRFNLGWSVGITYVANDVNMAGIAFGLNSAAFIGNNLSINGKARWSTINSNPVNQFDINLKYHFGWYYASIGYENLQIASPTYNFFTVGFGVYL